MRLQQIVLMIFFVCVSFWGNCQIRAGIKGGASVSIVRFKNQYVQESINARLGYYSGVYAEYDAGMLVFLRPELQYASKGYGFRPGQYNESGSVALNYITFHMLFGYRPNEKISFIVGPQVGWLVNAVVRTDGVKNTVDELYRRFDVGADLGASYRFSEKFAGEVRYSQGFRGLVRSEFSDASGIIVGDIKDGRNSVFQFGLSYQLYGK